MIFKNVEIGIGDKVQYFSSTDKLAQPDDGIVIAIRSDRIVVWSAKGSRLLAERDLRHVRVIQTAAVTFNQSRFDVSQKVRSCDDKYAGSVVAAYEGQLVVFIGNDKYVTAIESHWQACA